MEKQMHHCIPVSLPFGVNWIENTIDLSKHDHEIVHATLDVSYKLLRAFRIRTNHLVLKPDVYFVEEAIKLHKLYFSRVEHLPVKIITLHANALQGVSQRFKKENGIKVHPSSDFQNPLNKFHHFLNELHNDMLMVVKHKR